MWPPALLLQLYCFSSHCYISARARDRQLPCWSSLICSPQPLSLHSVSPCVVSLFLNCVFSNNNYYRSSPPLIMHPMPLISGAAVALVSHSSHLHKLKPPYRVAGDWDRYTLSHKFSCEFKVQSWMHSTNNNTDKERPGEMLRNSIAGL